MVGVWPRLLIISTKNSHNLQGIPGRLYLQMSLYEEVVTANAKYAADFGDLSSLQLPPARRFAVLTCMVIKFYLKIEVVLRVSTIFTHFHYIFEGRTTRSSEVCWSI